MGLWPEFIGGSYRSQSLIAAGARTMNWYVEPIEIQGAKNRVVFYPSPGFAPYASTTDVGSRAAFTNNDGRTFWIIGTTLYELTGPNALTARGTVAVDSRPGTICSNGKSGAQLGIASGGNFYCYNLLTNTLTQELTGEATMIGMMDGYFLAFNIVNGKVRFSGLNDGTHWDPTDFFQRSIAPDPWQAMVVALREIWLIGTQTTEVWYDANRFPVPFAPSPGAFFPYGTAAPFSARVIDGTVIWLAQTADGADVVVQATGYNPQPISHSALNSTLADYARTSTTADAEALSYRHRGRVFYVLTFRAANATVAWDATTGVWTELGSWNTESNQFDAWRPRVHAYSFGQHLVGDPQTGTIATMDTTIGTEIDGRAIRRMRIPPSLCREHRLLSLENLELHFESGLGLPSGQGLDPQVMLRMSRDGGQTWGNLRTRSAGRMGQYGARVNFVKCGSGRDLVPEITVSDPIPWRLVQAYVNNLGTSARAPQAAA